MFVCDYEHGNWIDPRIIPYKNIEIEPSANVLHYGQAVFEGESLQRQFGKSLLFRPKENYKRIWLLVLAMLTWRKYFYQL